ncbi:hypothetical protein GGI12_005634, partial [Dipsacomyces acuminosporus]
HPPSLEQPINPPHSSPTQSRLSLAYSDAASIPLYSGQLVSSPSAASVSNVTATGSIYVPDTKGRKSILSEAALLPLLSSSQPSPPPLNNSFTASSTLQSRLSRPLSFLASAIAPLQSLGRHFAGMSIGDGGSAQEHEQEQQSPERNAQQCASLSDAVSAFVHEGGCEIDFAAAAAAAAAASEECTQSSAHMQQEPTDGEDNSAIASHEASASADTDEDSTMESDEIDIDTDTDTNTDDTSDRESTVTGSGYESGDEDDGIYEYDYRMDDEFTQMVDEFDMEQVMYCQELPFWGCHFTPDTHEFILTHQLYYNDIRSPTEKEPPMEFMIEGYKYYPATPAIVKSMFRYLVCMYDVTFVHAWVRMDERLPPIDDFIYRVYDLTKVDLWTVIVCVILLQRLYRVRGGWMVKGRYETHHEVFLGAFLVAIMTTVKTNTPEVLTLDSIVKLIDTHYTKADLVRMRKATYMELNYNVWISRADVERYAERNKFDFDTMDTADLLYEDRMERRRILKERNDREDQYERDLYNSLK